MKKISLLLNGYILGVLAGCTTTTQSQYCLNVEEEVECPTVDEVNESTFPAEDCGGTHNKATDFSQRNDSVSVWEEDTAADAEFDACCYTTEYVAPVGVECVEGRPLKKEGAYLLAEVSNKKSDWSDAGAVSISKVGGAYWKHSAQMEHSSIAAFHICTLELLHFGAPANLIASAQQAAQDELRHAQSAFRIAAHLLGTSLHPESFPIPDIPRRTLLEFALEVALHGAINETLAVVLATHMRKEATDTSIQIHLDMLIEDEKKHALLAWDILHWAYAIEGERLRSSLLALVQNPPSFSLSSFPEKALPQWGLPARKTMEQVMNHAWHTLIQDMFVQLHQHCAA